MKVSNNSYWAKNAKNYDRNINEDSKILLNRIQNDIGDKIRVLDIAAGTGNVSLQLAKYSQYVDAIDIESEMIAVARKKTEEAQIKNISFHVQSAYELNFPDNSFDAVVILNSLHVMETPDLALNQARRVLKSNGLMIVPTYCHAETEETLCNYQKWSLKSGHKSCHLFTIDSLCELVTNNGFKIKTKDILKINQGEEPGAMIIGYIEAIPDTDIL